MYRQGARRVPTRSVLEERMVTILWVLKRSKSFESRNVRTYIVRIGQDAADDRDRQVSLAWRAIAVVA